MQELYEILPQKVAQTIKNYSTEKLYELRLRKNGVCINYGGKFFNIGVNVTEQDIDSVVMKATQNSVYAYNDMIKNGYLSLSCGIRIGICGEVITDKTIKNFTSLNIRIPHEVKGCALEASKQIVCCGTVKSTLIISPPGYGKTTFLRDLIRIVSDSGYNVLVCDQRYELCGDLGKNTDTLKGADKAFAFSRGVRYMRPDVIACDEMTDEQDFTAAENAISSGVKVLCTMHGEQERRVIHGIEKVVILSNQIVGKVEKIYDA